MSEYQQYWHNYTRYTIGLTGDQKLKQGVIAIKYDTNGKVNGSRVVHEWGHYKTYDEAARVLNSIAMHNKWQQW